MDWIPAIVFGALILTFYVVARWVIRPVKGKDDET